MRNQVFTIIKASVIAIILSFGLSFVYAWTAPVNQPPQGNVSAPINTSANAQTKEGAFTIGTISLPQVLTAIGSIGATGDICTTVTGSVKCLSTAGGGSGGVTNLSITELPNSSGAVVSLGVHSICTLGGSSINTAGGNYFYSRIYKTSGPDASGRYTWAYWSASNNSAYPISAICFDMSGGGGIGGGGLGYGTWQDVTASRSLETPYTNSTNSPILVSAVLQQATIYHAGVPSYVSAIVDTVTVASYIRIGESDGIGWNGNPKQITFIVPPNSTYKIIDATPSSGSPPVVQSWAELR